MNKWASPSYGTLYAAEHINNTQDNHVLSVTNISTNKGRLLTDSHQI